MLSNLITKLPNQTTKAKYFCVIIKKEMYRIAKI